MGTTLKFYINTLKKSTRDNRYPIYLRIIHNLKKSEGKISLISLKDSDLNFWAQESQRFNSSNKKFQTHDILLNAIENEFHNYLRDNITLMSDITPHEIRNHLLSRNKTDNATVIDVANQFYNDVVLPDVDKAIGTKKNYKKSINHLNLTNHLTNFLKYKKLELLMIKEFKKLHASLFIEYLKTPIPELSKIGLNSQSVNSIVRGIKPLFNKLLLEERIVTSPFAGIKVPFKRIEKPRLKNEDFRKIATLDLRNNITLEVYRDLFMFLCYTGLSFCDAIDIRYSEVEYGRFVIQRKKSKVYTRQFLTKQTLELIEKYRGNIPEDRILPKRSLDKMNLNLKVIAAKADIEFSLSTYTARRFFRQSIFESGIRETLVIKSLMGHTNKNDIDSHYFNVSDDILKDAKKKLQKHFKKLLK